MSPPPPVEWDFRQIPQAVAADALLYETLRTHRRLRTGFTSMLSARISGCPPVFTETLTIREIFVKYGNGELDVFERVMKYFPNSYPVAALRIMERYPTFPEPFSLTPMAPVYPNDEIIPFQIVDRKTASRDAMTFEIDDRASQTQVLNEVKKWVKKRFNLDRRGERVGRPFDGLKALAAYRLDNAKFTWKRAAELVDSRLKSHPLNSQTNVFPEIWFTVGVE